MANPKTKSETMKTAITDLVHYSFDKNDIKLVIEQIPEELTLNRVTIEYELQILKIITVGWGISYFMSENPYKDELTANFWNAVKEFSESISTTTSLFIGVDIEYFNILKERLEMYVKKLDENPDASDPAAIIGPVFAETCGIKDEVFTVMAGSRIFKFTLASVREYLESITL